MDSTVTSAYRKAVSYLPEPLRGGILGATTLIVIDVVLLGSYPITVYLCPIWAVLCVIKPLPRDVGAKIAVIRVLIPIFTMLLVLVNFELQKAIATMNGNSIAQACVAYRRENGQYPLCLEELVPNYLSSIPRAKYCCCGGRFEYIPDRQSDRPVLYWYAVPPFAKWVYCFEAATWRFLD